MNRILFTIMNMNEKLSLTKNIGHLADNANFEHVNI